MIWLRCGALRMPRHRSLDVANPPAAACPAHRGRGPRTVPARWPAPGSPKLRIDPPILLRRGIKIAQAAATKQKLEVEVVKEDIVKYDFGKNRWDLVTRIYAGSNPALVERVKPSVKKGGLFVVEFFHKDATAGSGISGFETAALAKQFGDGWTIIKDKVINDIADWTLRKTKLVRFTAQRVKMT